VGVLAFADSFDASNNNEKTRIMEEQFGGKPWIRIISPKISPPSLKDNTADVDRLIKGIKKGLQTERISVDFSLAKNLPQTLRECNYNVDAAVFEDQNGWHLIDIFPAHKENRIHGMAVDLGSSTVVARLVDLPSHEIRDEISFHNPQVQIGTDILTRIHFAAQEGGLEELQTLLIERLNSEIHQLTKKHHINPSSIVAISVAGNTTMTHLFLGLDPYWMCREPYIPVINKPDQIRSKDLGLEINPEAPALVFPNVGSYFGGDLIAGILASGMMGQDAPSILVDVGTNAEVVVGNCDWLMACAGAAGPALEGGVAHMGMMAGPGVIDHVRIGPHSGHFTIKTIGNNPAVGICGSGLIDLIAELFLAGMIDERGKYVIRKCADRLMEIDDINHLVIVPSEDSKTGHALTLSQPDIDALMRSKAAMMHEVSRFYIAGTFGSFIDPQSAITIGMLPDLPLKTYIPLGNTSLEGATMALLSAEAKEEIFHIRDQTTYLELNVNQEFMNAFSAAKFIPHTDRSLFPSVKVRAS
jgi:uncharacterized 2Fe-2S/4Fe-4S cluster protein (DUF4445 family)